MKNNPFAKKLYESFRSVGPIALIVALLSVTLTPMQPGIFLQFLFGAFLLVIGLSLFTLGSEMSMEPIGQKIGTTLGKKGNVWLIAFVSFLIGMIVTISEPDLQILANQVEGVENLVLILTVSIGVGIFLLIAMLRIVFHISLSLILAIFYAIAFGLCFFVHSDFWAVAFDSGGVTTGPMTVPFIMAIGAGVSSTSQKSKGDAFGLVSLCSIGPIIAVLILGILFSLSGGAYDASILTPMEDTREGLVAFFIAMKDYALEIGKALLPIIVFSTLFQVICKSFNKKQIVRILFGLLYIFVGLVVFLTGANEGFLSAGTFLGTALGEFLGGAFLIPVAMIIGFFIVNAEPAVYILNKQVERLTAGAVSASMMRKMLSIGVACALGLSMLRVLTGISILWILIPGYLAVFILTFFVPKFFIGIAFDSGGVASGTMMSAFVLPMAISSCIALDGNVMTDAFGCVAFVALTPILVIEISGILYKHKSKVAVNEFINAKENFIDYHYKFEKEKIEKNETNGKEEK